MRVSALSRVLSGAITIGMMTCWLVGPPGLNVSAWLVTAEKSPAAAVADPSMVEYQIVVGALIEPLRVTRSEERRVGQELRARLRRKDGRGRGAVAANVTG